MRGYAIDDGARRAAGKCPCIDCTDRFVGCHGVGRHGPRCPNGYPEWDARRQAFRAEAISAASKELQADAVYFDGRARALKNKGRKVVDKRQ